MSPTAETFSPDTDLKSSYGRDTYRLEHDGKIAPIESCHTYRPQAGESAAAFKARVLFVARMLHTPANTITITFNRTDGTITQAELKISYSR